VIWCRDNVKAKNGKMGKINDKKKIKKPQKCNLGKGDETNRRTRDESQ